MVLTEPQYIFSLSHLKYANPQAKLCRGKLLPAAQREERRIICEVQNFLLFHMQAGVNRLFMGGERRTRGGRDLENKKV